MMEETTETVERAARGFPAADPTPHPTVAERVARGRDARAQCSRTAHAAVEFPAERDPVAILEAQAQSRIPELVPIRYGRMLVSPLTFFRGAAAVMAHDLASTPRSGLQAQLCGDAHLGNFGGYASPERTLVFDLNDFDETLPGPFEWDVKRLAASFEVAGRDRNLTSTQRHKAVLALVEAYREAMRRFAALGELEVWYSRLDAQALEKELRAQRATKELRKFKQATARAYTKDSLKAFAQLTEVVNGERRIVSDPPLIVPLRELTASSGAPGEELERELHAAFRIYRHTLQHDRRHLLEQFRWIELARKVVGVGSVGTRCFILLMLGRDSDNPAVSADQGSAGVGARAASRSERLRQPRPAHRRGTAVDAGVERHPPRLVAARGDTRRHASRLLCPAALGLEGVRRLRRRHTEGARAVRRRLRLDAGARACVLG